MSSFVNLPEQKKTACDTILHHGSCLFTVKDHEMPIAPWSMLAQGVPLDRPADTTKRHLFRRHFARKTLLMSKRFWIILLLCILGLGGWYYVQHRQSEPGGTSKAGANGRQGGGGGRRGGYDPNASVPVVAGKVEEKNVPIYLDGLGTVQAYNTVTVKARIDGQLDKVAFTEGQDVKEGDVLAQIDPRPYQASLDQAIAKKAQDDAQLSNARLVLQRDKDLIEKKVLDQQSYDTQRFLVDQMVATVQADQAALDNARTQLDYTRITAPIAGRVGVRQVDQGNIIHASDTSGLVVITQLRPISVVFTLPEQNLQLIRDQYPAGDAQNKMQVVAVGRDNAGKLGDGTLAVIDNLIDQTTGTIKLKATFQNDDLRLWPGEFVNARLLLTTRENGLVVPASVVQRGPQGSYVFVIKDDQTVDVRPVKVAQTEDGISLIDEGLTVGETVVVDGQYKLQAGFEGRRVERRHQEWRPPSGKRHTRRARQGKREGESFADASTGDCHEPLKRAAVRR